MRDFWQGLVVLIVLLVPTLGSLLLLGWMLKKLSDLGTVGELLMFPALLVAGLSVSMSCWLIFEGRRADNSFVGFGAAGRELVRHLRMAGILTAVGCVLWIFSNAGAWL